MLCRGFGKPTVDEGHIFAFTLILTCQVIITAYSFPRKNPNIFVQRSYHSTIFLLFYFIKLRHKGKVKVTTTACVKYRWPVMPTDRIGVLIYLLWKTKIET